MTQFKKEKKPLSQSLILLHPPLVEVIFELRYELEVIQENQRMKDHSYPVMYGRIFERLRKELPIVEDLPSSDAHPETAPFAPRHRIRKGKDAYPLVQIGPGVITVNGDKNYSWDNFYPLVLRVIESVIDLYPHESFPLNFIKAELRYVNGIRFDISKESPLSFLAQKLHLHLEPDPDLYERVPIQERPNGLSLNISYPLEEPMGSLAIAATLGQLDSKPAVILQTLVQSFGELVPSDEEGFSFWLEKAHVSASNCFQTLCGGDLMQRFLGS